MRSRFIARLLTSHSRHHRDAPSSPYTPYPAYRMMGIVHAAMFDAVNSIERRCQAYLVQLPAESTPQRKPPRRERPLPSSQPLMQKRRLK
jgi:hypothetical protein